jgi:glycine/D-amino acid oxidase-like deaminating enzyme
VTSYSNLKNSASTDVAIVGAGIVGLSAAYLLTQAGLSVTVLEGRQIGRQVRNRFSASSRHRGLKKSTMNIPSECRTASIGTNHATILPHDANPRPDGISERTGDAWFLARHEEQAPDESTVRKRVALVWRELKR